jgi:Ca2+-binding RTX toxin-like protein
MSQASANEQYLLELINAERAKAGVQPLAFDGDLNEAAELHSAWQIATDTFSHTGAGGSNPGQRMTSAGYVFTGSWMWGENIAWASLRGDPGYQDEVLLMHNNLMNSSGHRANILNANFKEVGLGLEVGQYQQWQGAFITEDFAKSGTATFLTGVAFDDQDGDKFYDPGEGLSGITVTATNPSGVKFTALTEPAGGYDMTLTSGTYSVVFSGPNIATTAPKTVTIGSLNVKVDLVDPAAGTGTPPPPPPPSGTIAGTSGNDTLTGTSGNDTIDGLGGSDTLYGEAGGDAINGGSGRDYIYGGLGADTLTGSSGYDYFVFNTALSGGIDRITDFSRYYDTMRLENAVFTALTSTGTLASSAYYQGSAAHDATDRIIYNSGTGAVFYDPDGTGSTAAVQFALLGTGLNVTASDFVVV